MLALAISLWLMREIIVSKSYGFLPPKTPCAIGRVYFDMKAERILICADKFRWVELVDETK